MTTAHRFGTVAVVGRPNAGKSTLVNALVGERVAIVTPKAQTTRNRIVGIRTLPHAQVVLLDTPGVIDAETGLNRFLRRIAESARQEADRVLLVVDAGRGIGRREHEILAQTPSDQILVAVNKIDTVRKSVVLPQLAAIAAVAPEATAIPVSAVDGTQLAVLMDEIAARLPVGPPAYGEDDYTTASIRFLAQEIVREQVLLQTRAEIPYQAAVVVESIADVNDITRVEATVLVARPSHKGIVIGAGGERVKGIGQAARPELERLLGRQVHLALQVSVEENWLGRPDRVRALELV